MARQALASSSTTATPNSGSRYDIFINYCGPDVKKAFASHLRNLFEHGKLRAFLDKDALEVGENVASQIEGAIASASVHIAIFSPTYAESPWCLNELLQMLDTGAPIIPVFYHVRPTELRWTHGRSEGWLGQLLREGRDGVYAISLRKLEKKKMRDAQTGRKRRQYEPSTIEKWRDALSRVADITGLELSECNGDEGTLANKIVQRVRELLKEKESRKGMEWLFKRLCKGNNSEKNKVYPRGG